jgi:hypothetical protein
MALGARERATFAEERLAFDRRRQQLEQEQRDRARLAQRQQREQERLQLEDEEFLRASNPQFNDPDTGRAKSFDSSLVDQAKKLKAQRLGQIAGPQPNLDAVYPNIASQLTPQAESQEQAVLRNNTQPNNPFTGQALKPGAIQSAFGGTRPNIVNRAQQPNIVNQALSSAAQGAGDFFSGVGDALGGFVNRFREGFGAGMQGLSVYEARAMQLNNQLRQQKIQEIQRVRQAEDYWPQVFGKFKQMKANGDFTRQLQMRKFGDKQNGRENSAPFLTESDVEAVLRNNGFTERELDAIFLSRGGVAALTSLGVVPTDILQKGQERYATQKAQTRADIEAAEKELLSLQTLINQEGLRERFTQSLGAPKNEFLPDLVAGLDPNATHAQRQRAQSVRKKMDTFATSLLKNGIDAASDTITKDKFGPILASVGMPQEQIDALPDVASSSMIEKLMTQTGQTNRAQATRKSIADEKRKDREARKTEREASQQFKTDFFDHTQPVKTRDKIYVQTIATLSKERTLRIKLSSKTSKPRTG